MQTIHLVHDQQESAATRRSFLEMSGFRVVPIRSSRECLERIALEKPDLALIDVLIEGLNGFELCRRIRTTFEPAELPVILGSTIYRSRIYRDEALRAGAQRYLLRPVKLDELVRQISEVLSGTCAASDPR